jgi:hypothetical protein
MGAGADDVGRQDAGLATLVAGLSAGAGLIHFTVVAEHTGGDAIVPIGFVLFGLAQIGLAVALLAGWRRTQVVAATAAVNLAALGVWAWSRTAGLPFDPYGGVAEPVASIDLTAAILQALAVTAAAGMLAAPSAIRLPRAGALAAGVAALGVASMVVVAPDSASTTAAAGAAAGSGGGHSHGAASAMPAAASSDSQHALEMIQLDRARCDLAFNPQAYWDEAPAFGVDIYGGGDMTMPAPTGMADISRPPLLDGRGSQHLDSLISFTSIGSGEAAAAQLIQRVAEATDEEYLAWRQWVATNVNSSHTDGHAAPAAGQSTTPTMGHPGPQQWRAMIDQAACEQLSAELDLARATAARYSTVADATAAGWRRVTPYLPGIAAHYMNFSLVDDQFNIEEPEMLLFDGIDPDSRIVGLSYYINLEGDGQPSQGFVGENDHYHRHFGLCVGPGGVIGDSTTTDEECAAMGGRKSEGSGGWMSHAWVVPGCESPWGVFSGENPILDMALAEASGDPGAEGCAASEARARYDLSAGASDLLVRGGGGDREEAAGS